VEVIVGRVGRPHGIKGDVSVEVRTDDPEGRLAPGTTVRTDPGAAGPLTVESGRVHSGRLLLHFAGHDDRAAAERLRGVLLLADVDPAERPEDPEEFYDHQLVGLRVETTAGEAVGELERVEHNAAQDLLVIRTPERQVLFPFVSALVPEVDVPGGRIVIDDRPGLLGEY
jgi:16S rRNA processing protein RimM